MAARRAPGTIHPNGADAFCCRGAPVSRAVAAIARDGASTGAAHSGSPATFARAAPIDVAVAVRDHVAASSHPGGARGADTGAGALMSVIGDRALEGDEPLRRTSKKF